MAISSPRQSTSVETAGAANVFASGVLRIIVWHHGGHLEKAVQLLLDGQVLARPYLGFALTPESAAFLASTGSINTGREAELRIESTTGKKAFFQSPATSVAPFAAIPSLLEPEAWQRLVTGMLERAPGKTRGWSSAHERELLAILGASVADQPADSSTTAEVESVSAADERSVADQDSEPRDEQPVVQLSAAAEPSISEPEPDRVELSPPATASALIPVAESEPAPSRRAAIDSVDGRRVYGWAVDGADATARLLLKFYVNGAYAGECVADDPSVRLSSDHGFHVTLHESAFANTRPIGDSDYLLDVRDGANGTLLIEAQRIRYRPRGSSTAVLKFDERLQQLEQLVSDLRAELPRLRQQAAQPATDYAHWFDHYHFPTQIAAPAMAAPQSPGAGWPSFSIVVPLYPNMSLGCFDRVLESLLQQQQQHRMVCRVIAFGEFDGAYEALAKGAAKKGDLRLHWVGAEDASVLGALLPVVRDCLEDITLFLAPGEALHQHALWWFSRAAVASSASLFYADSERVDAEGARVPALRPELNRDLLLSMPYIGTFAVRRERLQQLVVADRELELLAWSYQLLLNALEVSDDSDWCHIARVLSASEDSERPDGAARESAFLSALRQHLSDPAASAVVMPVDAGALHGPIAAIDWPIPKPTPLVSIIICTKDAPEVLKQCVDGLLNRTKYATYEVIIVDHESAELETTEYLSRIAQRSDVRVVEYQGAFNWSAMNNLAAAQARGSLLCFLNNDTNVLESGWLQAMVAQCSRDGVGVVGAKLIGLDNKVQHGGIVLGANGGPEHAFTGLDPADPGYAGLALAARQVSAVTGACLMCSQPLFKDLGGFDSVNLGVAFSDVDFCLRAKEAGYRTLWTPAAQLQHVGSHSRSDDRYGPERLRFEQERAYLEERWSEQLKRDPFYNPGFEHYNEPYAALTASNYGAF